MIREFYILFGCVFLFECLVVLGQKKDAEPTGTKSMVNEDVLNNDKIKYRFLK